MRTLPALIALFITAGTALACPGAADMAKGVEVKTVSPRGEGNTFVFRKTGSAQVDETRTSHWISGSNTVQTRLIHGLLPTTSELTKSTHANPVLQDKTTRYPAQNIKALEIKENSRFTLNAISKAKDGFTMETVTTYDVGRSKPTKVGDCRLDVITVTATTDWDGIISTQTILYFKKLGFGIEVKDKNPGKTFEKRILSIAAR